MSKEIYDIVGVGIGPFNLSLAALLAPLKELKIKFCDAKEVFKWHPELMLDDAPMQTSFLKDLVTPIDPTNPYSFMNYLVKKGQFYHFLSTNRNAITRYEFQDYLSWCSTLLAENLDFNTKILDIYKKNENLVVVKDDGEYLTKNICIASGPVENIPEAAIQLLGANVFHAKSKELGEVNLKGKRVLIVGAGQTGIEIFKNALNEKWGQASDINLLTGREGLLPLEEGPFTNEIFTPDFVSEFYKLPQNNKDEFSRKLVLASDGNTPSYLQSLYNDLYLDKFYYKKYCSYQISPMRWMEKLEQIDNSYCALIRNKLNNKLEEYRADIVILATGFTTKLPPFMETLRKDILFDSNGRVDVSLDYKLKTKFVNNKIYAMNYSRHGHGLADPQTSLMSWRSAVIANDLLKREHYLNLKKENSFLEYF